MLEAGRWPTCSLHPAFKIIKWTVGKGWGADGPAIKALARREEGQVLLMYACIARVFLGDGFRAQKRENKSSSLSLSRVAIDEDNE